MSDPLTLLSGKTSKSFLSDLYNPGIGGVLGFLGACFVNWGTRRPVFSGIQKHLIATSAGLVIGKVVDGWRNDYLAERDAVLRHYIELHPEDFLATDRKKYGDILVKWIPIR